MILYLAQRLPESNLSDSSERNYTVSNKGPMKYQNFCDTA